MHQFPHSLRCTQERERERERERPHFKAKEVKEEIRCKLSTQKMNLKKIFCLLPGRKKEEFAEKVSKLAPWGETNKE